MSLDRVPSIRRTLLIMVLSLIGALIASAIDDADGATKWPAGNPFACQGSDHKYSPSETIDCVVPRVFAQRRAKPSPVPTAKRIVRCESEGRTPEPNPASTARGPWQFLAGTWANVRGVVGKSRDHPVWSTVGAFNLSAGGRDWSPWYASRHCWGG